MRKHKSARYRVIARNRPGELARLAGLLASEGVALERLTVASLDEEEAAIDFTAPESLSLPERLARCGLRCA
jgi:acetolactate synthase small subunit